jgi:hypothetical protein
MKTEAGKALSAALDRTRDSLRSDEPYRAFVGQPVCSLHSVAWGTCSCAQAAMQSASREAAPCR